MDDTSLIPAPAEAAAPAESAVPVAPIPMEKAARLYRQGWTLRRLAPLVGCAHQTLHDRLVKAGVAMRPLTHSRAKRLPESKRQEIRQALAEQPIATWVARKVHVGVNTVRKLAKEEGIPLGDGRRWSPVDRPLVKAMRGDGMTIHVIAERTGYHWHTIWRTLNRAGLTQRNSRTRNRAAA